jgi:hypothetical protein
MRSESTRLSVSVSRGRSPIAAPLPGLSAAPEPSINNPWTAGGGGGAAGKDIAHFDGTNWSQVADAPASVRDNTDATVFDEAVVVGDATTTWLTNAGPVFVRKAAGASP